MKREMSVVNFDPHCSFCGVPESERTLVETKDHLHAICGKCALDVIVIITQHDQANAAKAKVPLP